MYITSMCQYTPLNRWGGGEDKEYIGEDLWGNEIMWESLGSGRLSQIFNRPGVAGAVLQSPPSLIH